MHQPQHFTSTHLFFLLFFIIGCCLSASVWADTVEEKLPSGFVATAHFKQGETTKPAALIVHGFLATRNFRTVANLSSSLYDDGYTVLAPNLTLGINRRKVSLACEAIHSHSIQDDIAEINFWVDWLVAHGNKSVVLVGHSFGSLHTLSYYLAYKHPAVKKIIATSLIDIENSIASEIAASQIISAQNMATANDKQLGEYKMSYCKKYVAPPKAFLSYAKWTKSTILDGLTQINTPVEIIIGSADQRMSSDWINSLSEANVKLTLIEGANHFFDNEHEFDLLDKVIESLSKLKLK